MNDKIKYHLCFKYVCNWITLLIFKHTLLITSHGSCVFKAFYRKFNNRYMFLRKFHKIEMKADLDVDEIWRSVWLGLFLRWVKIFTIQIKIFIHQKHTSIAKLWLDPSDMTDAPVVKPDSELIQDVVLPVDLILVTPFRSKSPVLRCFFNLSPWKKEDKLD